MGFRSSMRRKPRGTGEWSAVMCSYDVIVFHRVIEGFMAQTGDPRGDGTGGSGKKLKAEFNAAKHVRGTVSMARSQSADSADSQFFICFPPPPFLPPKYTAWAPAASAMEHIHPL